MGGVLGVVRPQAGILRLELSFWGVGSSDLLVISEVWEEGKKRGEVGGGLVEKGGEGVALRSDLQGSK